MFLYKKMPEPVRRFKFFEPLYLSFFSKDVYLDAAKNWGGMTFAYLLMLVAVCWAPRMINLHQELAYFLDTDAQAIASQVPRIDINDGVATSEASTPYEIKEAKTGKTFMIIDLREKHTAVDELGDNVIALLTRSQFIMKKNKTETRAYDLSEVKSFYLDRTRVKGWMELARKWTAIVLYVFIVAFMYVYRIIQAVIYAVIGILVSKFVQIELGFDVLMNLSIIAITPPVIINTVVSLAEISIPFWGWLCFAMAIGYLIFGIKALKDSSQATVPSDVQDNT
ncbi:DUF1189 family protein [Elusimicrobiota bacterium]